MSIESHISFNGIEKKYLRKEPLFRDLSLSIKQKEFVFLTGISGSGKSTFFKLIMGLEMPDKGSVCFNGETVNLIPPRQMPYHRRGIGIVFQDLKLLQKKTAYENIILPLLIRGVSKKQIQSGVKRVSKRLSIEPILKQPVQALSGGEQQLVAIARATISVPRIILADEPTANLDQAMAHKILETFNNLNANGATVIIATHDVGLIKAYQKRVLLIKDQNIIDVE
ncbi:MAG: ATP-binding cassette domain-containing protein [Deltaproteobacteria bacterium]|nr:ATP-binding cassette domain-containing protein [Deltaproteobacteria bacterium]